jgi:hypothetical protein
MKKNTYSQIISIVLLALVLTACSLKSQEKKEVALFPVTKDGKAGYIDTKGEIKIPLQYDAAEPFSEGLAAVKQGDRWGYINADGEMLIQPILSMPSSFHDGRAWFSENDKFGFIDTTGAVIIPAEYDFVESFSDQMAKVMVCTAKKPCDWLNLKIGDKIIAGLPIHGEEHFIDLDGKTVLTPASTYSKINSFHEGLAAVEQDNKYGYIDQSGKLVIPIQFDIADDFSEGLAHIVREMKHGYIDKSGKLVIEGDFVLGKAFFDGLARVNQSGSFEKYGYIDKTGKMAIPFQFDATSVTLNPLEGAFSEGFAPVEQGDKFGFIDKSGEVVIPAQYDRVGDFYLGIAPVWVDEMMGYINTKGEYIWQPSK